MRKSWYKIEDQSANRLLSITNVIHAQSYIEKQSEIATLQYAMLRKMHSRPETQTLNAPKGFSSLWFIDRSLWYRIAYIQLMTFYSRFHLSMHAISRSWVSHP